MKPAMSNSINKRIDPEQGFSNLQLSYRKSGVVALNERS